MSISIQQIVFDKYNEVVDYLFTNPNLSKTCTLYYPSIKEVCNNCQALGNVSNNSYSHGGPSPFSFNSCGLCGGAGFREKITTSTIKLRVYWRKRDWIKQGNIIIPNAECMILGKITDLQSIMTCKEIALVDDQKIMKNRYKLSCEPFYHGFGNRYFITYLERV